jgi:DNA polymerase I-like protein with 3'-5' exonuclease and polymerase domains
MMSTHLLDENRPKDLKSVVDQELGIAPWGIDLSAPEDAPWQQLAHYNAQDTDYCYQLHELHRQQLKEDEAVARVWHYIGMPAIRAFIHVEHTGLGLDLEQVQSLTIASESELTRTERELYQWIPEHLLEEFGEDQAHTHTEQCAAWKCPVCGVEWTHAETKETDTVKSANPPHCVICERTAIPKTCRKKKDKRYPISWSPTSKFFAAFMGAMAPVIETTPKGAPCWDAAVLSRLAQMGYPFAQTLLSYRDHRKKLDFLFDWQNRAVNARLYPSYKPAHVVSGRTSSQEPNIQQTPKSLRSAITAPPGYWFVEVDHSQIELRVAAELASRATAGKAEPRMLQAYLREQDLHTLMAARITGKKPENVSGTERFHAKAANFGFLYGMTSATFSTQAWRDYQLDFDPQQAAELRSAFFEQWPEIGLWHEHQRLIARRGQVRSLLGRKRRLPDIDSGNPAKVGEAQRMAINAPVQSLASDLTLLGMIAAHKALDPAKARVVGTVHDSVLLEVSKAHLTDCLKVVSDALLYPDLKGKFGVELTVPLKIEYAIGRFWADPKAREVQVHRKGT